LQVKDNLMLAIVQDQSYVIMLGKWWQVLLVLIAIVGIVWLAKILFKKFRTPHSR
jgi:hypothetical protein